MRDGGETLIVDIFKILVKSKSKSGINEQNFNYANDLRDLGITVVFAFDEANKLMEIATKTVALSDGKMEGSLFHAIYKQIHKFNNVVFLGTTYSITAASINISGEGREFVKKIIGTLSPWFLEDVKEILFHKFKLEN